MSDGSGIEWTEATWNPVTGCTKVSQGCKHCYAERDWKRLSANPFQPVYHGRAFTDVQCHPERLQIPLLWTRARRIFVNSMSDLFHEAVPFEFIDQVFAVMSVTTRHTYQVLTKRADRMLEYFTSRGPKEDDDHLPPGFFFPDQVSGPDVWPAWTPAGKGRGGYDNCGPSWPLVNVHLGVSCEDQETADARIPYLLLCPAAVRFISAEPLLARLDLTALPFRTREPGFTQNALTGKATFPAQGVGGHADVVIETQPLMQRLGWVIVGGESGPHARPMDPAWARSLRDQCAVAGVPFFFKQWGEWLPVHIEPDTGDGTLIHPIDDSLSLPPGRRFVLKSEGGSAFAKVHKKAAGRVLDGRTHDEFPQASGNG